MSEGVALEVKPEPDLALEDGAMNGHDACQIDSRFILAWLSPRWFIFVMGTGALANIHQMIAGKSGGWLHYTAEVLLVLGGVAFAIVSLLKLWRLFAYWRCVAQEWTHSSLMQFYSAIPIAAAVLSTGLLRIPLEWMSEAQRVALATGLWWLALVLSVFFVVLIPLRVILGEHAEPKRALGFWFLPPVGLFVVVFDGNFLSGHLSNPASVAAMFEVNTIILGLALLLTVAVFTIFLFRAFFYRFPRPDVTPSYVIGLAPIGVSIIALNTWLPVYAKVSPAGLPPVEILGPVINLLSLLLWSFGLWWAVVAVGIVGTKLARGGVPVTLGYWAFIFPPAAYTISTLLLAGKLSYSFLFVTGYIMAALVSVAWLVVAGLVIRNTLNLRIFELPPSFQDLDTSVI
ncbi:MAG: hypothetical protein J7M38_15445 [Armatimonadetes bacterium]|nr:hypothetical protein [Armatimonadota bacterium]